MDLWACYATHTVCMCATSVRAESHYILLLKKIIRLSFEKCVFLKYIDRFGMDLWTLRCAFRETFRPLVVLNAFFFLFFKLFVLNNGLNEFNLWPNG